MGGEPPGMIDTFVRQTAVTFPVGLDASGSWREFPYSGALSPFPLDVIIDKNGNIAYAKREYNANAMIAVIEKLLAE